MPGPCHHCGENVDDGDGNGIDGRCSTCNTAGRFCLHCGWWEIGPLEEYGYDIAAIATQQLTASADVITPCRFPNPAVMAVTDQCALLKSLFRAKAWFTNTDHEIRYWAGTIQNLDEAATKAVNWMKGFLPDDEDDPYGRRMRAMLIVYLAAYQQCLEEQVDRMIRDNPFAYLSLHDAPAIAAKHFSVHDGFGIDGDCLEADVLALRHIDTVEQYLKGKMSPGMAGWLIRRDIPEIEPAGSMAARAFLLHLAALTVMRPYAQNRLPNRDKFGPDARDNLASGVYRAEYISGLIPDVASRATSLAAKARLKTLYDAIVTRPDFGGRLFRFNTVESDAVLDGGTLSEAQKLYLKSLQDLDRPDCPSACRVIIARRTRDDLRRVLRALGESEGTRNLLNGLGETYEGHSALFEEGNLNSLIKGFIRRGTEGRFLLQTCANDISFISNKRYAGILSVYARKMQVSEILGTCPAGQDCQDEFVGSRYMRSDVLKASDERKLAPYNYMSWRVQKDRAAHKFFPLSYDDYDVTAAISQTYPLPEPQPTYGPQMIVWKKSIVPFCTYKIRDSGRPTRSFLLLLHDMVALAVAGDGQVRLALLNLLLQVASSIENDARVLFKAYIDTLYTQRRPMRCLDIEAHLYGDIRLGHVDAIVYPCAPEEQQEKLAELRNTFPGCARVLYDPGPFRTRADTVDGGDGAEWLMQVSMANPQ